AFPCVWCRPCAASRRANDAADPTIISSLIGRELGRECGRLAAGLFRLFAMQCQRRDANHAKRGQDDSFHRVIPFLKMIKILSFLRVSKFVGRPPTFFQESFSVAPSNW